MGFESGEASALSSNYETMFPIKYSFKKEFEPTMKTPETTSPSVMTGIILTKCLDFYSVKA
jgi:hypothetical protein